MRDWRSDQSFFHKLRLRKSEEGRIQIRCEKMKSGWLCVGVCGCVYVNTESKDAFITLPTISALLV